MKIIVIDDDPTGSQTVNNCFLLVKWNHSTLVKALKSKSNLFFILANTRSLSENNAKLKLEEICNTIKGVISSKTYREDIIFVSRGDSTLRGHNFLEPNTINDCLGPFDATFHIPAFIEGKRLTINGKHFVDNIPANQTIFAKDKIFGYQTNDIRDLLFQKSKLELKKNNIENLKLSELNSLENNEENIVFQRLRSFQNNTHVIVDVKDYSQLDKFSNAIHKLKKQKKFLFRTAASFISSISQIRNNEKNNSFYSHLRRKNSNNNFLRGLIIIGSHVKLTTIQLREVLRISFFKPIELDVFEFFRINSSKDNNDELIVYKNQFLNAIRSGLNEGKTPVLFTSRKVISLVNNEEQIGFNNSLANFIAEIVSDVKNEIGYLISKGGVTSNVILSRGLKADYVYLEGQILTGISLVTFKLRNNENLPVVTFPGNIGDKYALLKVWNILENSDNLSN